jgi:hypothetical protein
MQLRACENYMIAVGVECERLPRDYVGGPGRSGVEADQIAARRADAR